MNTDIEEFDYVFGYSSATNTDISAKKRSCFSSHLLAKFTRYLQSTACFVMNAPILKPYIFATTMRANSVEIGSCRIKLHVI